MARRSGECGSEARRSKAMIFSRGDPVGEDLLTQIRRELERDAQAVNAIRHGKLILYIQDGKLVRIERTESKQTA